MNIIFLIAKRFLISKNLSQGGMINIVSFLGLFIGAASIVLSIAVLNGFQNILGDETKKLYGDYILLDTNEDFVRNSDNDFKYSPFFEEEFFVLKENKQSLIKLKTVFKSLPILLYFFTLPLLASFHNTGTNPEGVLRLSVAGAWNLNKVTHQFSEQGKKEKISKMEKFNK